MKNPKKYILGLSSLATVAAPVAAVVSCGGSKTPIDHHADHAKEFKTIGDWITYLKEEHVLDKDFSIASLARTAIGAVQGDGHEMKEMLQHVLSNYSQLTKKQKKEIFGVISKNSGPVIEGLLAPMLPGGISEELKPIITSTSKALLSRISNIIINYDSIYKKINALTVVSDSTPALKLLWASFGEIKEQFASTALIGGMAGPTAFEKEGLQFLTDNVSTLPGTTKGAATDFTFKKEAVLSSLSDAQKDWIGRVLKLNSTLLVKGTEFTPVNLYLDRVINLVSTVSSIIDIDPTFIFEVFQQADLEGKAAVEKLTDAATTNEKDTAYKQAHEKVYEAKIMELVKQGIIKKDVKTGADVKAQEQYYGVKEFHVFESLLDLMGGAIPAEFQGVMNLINNDPTITSNLTDAFSPLFSGIDKVISNVHNASQYSGMTYSEKDSLTQTVLASDAEKAKLVEYVKTMKDILSLVFNGKEAEELTAPTFTNRKEIVEWVVKSLADETSNGLAKVLTEAFSSVTPEKFTKPMMQFLSDVLLKGFEGGVVSSAIRFFDGLSGFSFEDMDKYIKLLETLEPVLSHFLPDYSNIFKQGLLMINELTSYAKRETKDGLLASLEIQLPKIDTTNTSRAIGDQDKEALFAFFANHLDFVSNDSFGIKSSLYTVNGLNYVEKYPNKYSYGEEEGKRSVYADIFKKMVRKGYTVQNVLDWGKDNTAVVGLTDFGQSISKIINALMKALPDSIWPNDMVKGMAPALAGMVPLMLNLLLNKPFVEGFNNVFEAGGFIDGLSQAGGFTDYTNPLTYIAAILKGGINADKTNFEAHVKAILGLFKDEAGDVAGMNADSIATLMNGLFFGFTSKAQLNSAFDGVDKIDPDTGKHPIRDMGIANMTVGKVVDLIFDKDTAELSAIKDQTSDEFMIATILKNILGDKVIDTLHKVLNDGMAGISVKEWEDFFAALKTKSTALANMLQIDLGWLKQLDNHKIAVALHSLTNDGFGSITEDTYNTIFNVVNHMMSMSLDPHLGSALFSLMTKGLSHLTYDEIHGFTSLLPENMSGMMEFFLDKFILGNKGIEAATTQHVDGSASESETESTEVIYNI